MRFVIGDPLSKSDVPIAREYPAERLVRRALGLFCLGVVIAWRVLGCERAPAWLGDPGLWIAVGLLVVFLCLAIAIADRPGGPIS